MLPHACLAATLTATLLAAPPAAAAPPAETAPTDTVESAIAAGQAAMDAEDYAGAVKAFDRAAELGGSTPELTEMRAEAHFRLGTLDYTGGSYQTALEHFQDAQGMFPSPQFHYNIGQCYEALDKLDEAIASYRAYLRGVPDANDKASVERKIQRLEELSALRRQQAADDASPTPTPASREDRSAPPGRKLMVGGGVLTGLGVAIAAGGGIAFGALAKSRSDDLESIYEGNVDGLTLADAESLDTQGKRFEALQITSVAIGGALAITGVALLAVGAKQRRAASSTQAHRRPSLAPHIGRDAVGLTIAGRF
jgi:tetratricopeptide (TPR) repeat protein